MNQTRNDVINQLVEDLPTGNIRWVGTTQTIVWLILGTIMTVVLTIMAGPLRPGVGEQLVSEPRFLLETILGVVAITSAGVVAIKTAVPAGNHAKLVVFTVIAMILWLSNYVIGLYFPTMELGMLGKRAHCLWETILFALPTMAMGFWIVKRGYVLNWPLAGFAIGLVAGFIPGYLMQLACMYDARHILTAHIAPVFVVGILGALVGVSIQYWSNRPRRVDTI